MFGENTAGRLGLDQGVREEQTWGVKGFCKSKVFYICEGSNNNNKGAQKGSASSFMGHFLELGESLSLPGIMQASWVRAGRAFTNANP